MTTLQTSQAKKQTPPEIAGTVTVTKEAFFATVGKLDVHPCPTGKYDPVFGYRSDWKLRDGRIIGFSNGGTTFSTTRYMVTQRFYDANRALFEQVQPELAATANA